MAAHRACLQSFSKTSKLKLAVELLASLACVSGLNCWAGDFTAATCCDTSYGPQGNPSCWDGTFTYEACCSRSSRSRAASSLKDSKPMSLSRKKPEVDGIVVGIDLGTTYSAVAVMRNGQTEVIQNDQGNRITPSMVAFLDNGERLIGEAAKNELHEHPKQTIYDAKRLIGRGFQDRSVQMDKKSFPFRVVDRAGRPHIEIARKNQKTMVIAPEEVSAAVLSKMKTIAEAYLGEEVRHAVVTVPAYFNDNQRSATMAAGEIAGLNVVRVLNEPTAAAIAYGFGQWEAKKSKGETKILVYDLGGGTFDVSVLLLAEGVYQTLATCGNTHLGGEDFDVNIVNYMVGQFKSKTSKDPTRDHRAMQKLKMAVEGAKRILSVSPSTSVEIEDFFQGRTLNEKLSRAKFEQLNGELFSKTLGPVKQALKDAGLSKEEINKVVLVGGSTRIPKVRQLVREFFGLSESAMQNKLNPDEAVAIGAAIQAEVLWRGSPAGQLVLKGKSMWEVASQTWDIVLVDVTPLSLGIELEGGHMAVLVPRNTALPTKKTKTFTTVQNHQTTVYIPIYEGERPIAKKNSKLGQMILSGIPPAPAGVPQVDVTFRIDTNGILHVTAQDQGTKADASVTIDAQKGRLSEEDVENMIRKAEKHAKADQEMLQRRDARSSLSAYLGSLQSSLLAGAARQKLSEEDASALEEAIRGAEDWLRDAQKATLEEIQEQKQHVEDVANPIVSRMYGRASPDVNVEDDAGGSDTADEGSDSAYDEDAWYDENYEL